MACTLPTHHFTLPTSQKPRERRFGKRSRAQPSSAPFPAPSDPWAGLVPELTRGTAEPSLPRASPDRTPRALLAQDTPQPTGHRQGEGEGPGSTAQSTPGAVSPRRHRPSQSALHLGRERDVGGPVFCRPPWGVEGAVSSPTSARHLRVCARTHQLLWDPPHANMQPSKMGPSPQPCALTTGSRTVSVPASLSVAATAPATLLGQGVLLCPCV